MPRLERRGLQSRDLALLSERSFVRYSSFYQGLRVQPEGWSRRERPPEGGVPVLCEPRHGRFGSQVVFAELHMTPVRALAEMMVEGRLCQQIDGPASGPAID